VTWSWQGALTAFFWAGIVRIGLLHHITWSINSVCHVYGERPFEVRNGDKAANFWPLAILSFGKAGTTCTTRIRPAPGTACCAVRSTSRRG
jgi:stearoyl-CoA desaturase (delta-9 desaturase)